MQTTPQPGDAAAAGAEDVADVVVRAADDAVDVALVDVDHARGVVVAVRLHHEDDVGLVGDQDHPHRDVALVDAVHAVHGGDDPVVEDVGLQGRHRRAVEVAVLDVGGQGQAVGAEGVAGGGEAGRIGTGDAVSGNVVGQAAEGVARRRAVVALEVADVMGGVAAPVGIDVDGPARGQDDGVEAGRRPAEAGGRRRVVQPLPAERADLGELGGEGRLHDRGLLDAEAAHCPVRQREDEHDGARLVARFGREFQRRLGERPAQRIRVELEEAESRGEEHALPVPLTQRGLLDVPPRRRSGREGGLGGKQGCRAENLRECRHLHRIVPLRRRSPAPFG